MIGLKLGWGSIMEDMVDFDVKLKGCWLNSLNELGFIMMKCLIYVLIVEYLLIKYFGDFSVLFMIPYTEQPPTFIYKHLKCMTLTCRDQPICTLRGLRWEN